MPTHRLRRGVSYCLCNGRAVFLDLARDRYFCLPAELEIAFLALAAGESVPVGSGALDRLIAHGLLSEQPLGGEIVPTSLSPAIGDLVAAGAPPASTSDLMRALWMQVRVAIDLRCCSLATTLRRAGRGGHRAGPAAQADVRLRAIAAAFAASGLFVHAADRCLPRALAMHRLCKAEGIRADLVFGIRLDPFAAHCWVQSGDRVVIGEFEQVRTYTPILRLR